MRFEFSAGGVVFKKEKKGVYVLIAQAAQHHGWVFPKGLIGDHKKGEKKEETAVREVEEETGVKAKILKPLKPITYWFVWKKDKVKKTVYYFLMEFEKNSPEKKDDEMENVEWILASKVEEKLTYPSDKKVWQEAKGLIE